MPDTSAPSWHATLLGAAKVEGPNGPVERLRTRAAFLLLVYLLLHRSRSHARDELADRFWPNDDAEAARGKLRLALHSIRGALGPLVEADRHAVWIAWPERVETDRDELVRLVAPVEGTDRAARLERAIALYQGPFLPGFYDDWAVEERERLEAVVSRALRETAEAHAAAGRWVLALESAGRLVALEPYDEAAHVLVLGALSALGRGEALARTLEWTRERFAEVGRRPGKAIEAFAREAATEEDETEDGSVILGREADLARTLRAIGECPVVTLWGPPGVGKTRLAREAVRALDDDPAFVSAVGLGSVEALRGALGTALGGDAANLDELAEGAAPRLLVVDNLESLPDEAIALFADLRARNPGLRFLFTSQRPAGLPGEVVVPLAPLAVPPEGASPAQVAASVSVRLLRERARERGRRLRVDESNANALAALCRRLEGVPLALELAAEWLDVMGPADILDRLDESGRRLDARLPGRDPRHRSLETAIAASIGRLDPVLGRALADLSVFAGGWDLAAAEAVIGDDAAAILAELASRSLVKVEPVGDGVRYGMLESIRLYQRAVASDLGAAQLRHAAHFAKVGAAMQADATSLVARYRADDENVRLAAETILRFEEDPERAAQAIGGFQGYWQKLGRWELAQTTLRRALDRLPSEPSLLKCRIYVWLAYVGFSTDDLELGEWASKMRHETAIALGNPRGVALAGGSLGIALMHRGDFVGALPHLRGFLQAMREQNHGFNGGDILIALENLATLLLALDEETEGYALLQEMLRLASEAEAQGPMAEACLALGRDLRLRKRPEEAEPYLRRAVELEADLIDSSSRVSVHARLSATLGDRGDLCGARASLRRALSEVASTSRPIAYAELSEAAAWVAAASGADLLAARLLGSTTAWRRRTIALVPVHARRLSELRDLLRERLGAEPFARETLAGETGSRKGVLADVLAVIGTEYLAP